MDKLAVIQQVMHDKIVAVIRAESKEQGIRVCEAVAKGGIKILEVTLTVPGAIDIIKELSANFAGTDVLIGAGTVLDSETARQAILAGAKFIVSPSFDEGLIRLCNRYRIACMPGAMTIQEVVQCLEMGADIVKVFPGSAFGPSIIKDFKGPLPQANFMPTGGVSIENINEWLKAGAVAVGTGGSLTAGAKSGDYDAVTKAAQEFVSKVHG